MKPPHGMWYLYSFYPKIPKFVAKIITLGNQPTIQLLFLGDNIDAGRNGFIERRKSLSAETTS